MEKKIPLDIGNRKVTNEDLLTSIDIVWYLEVLSYKLLQLCVPSWLGKHHAIFEL